MNYYLDGNTLRLTLSLCSLLGRRFAICAPIFWLFYCRYLFLVRVNALKSCDVVLDRRNYKSAGTWDKLKMGNLHKYNHFDFVECLNQLDKKSLKKMLHVQFFGDSRIRQQFMSFVEVLV